MADREPVGEGQLGMDAAIAVDAAGVGMDLADELCEPGVADHPYRRRSGPPGVVAGLPDAEHSTGHLHGPSLCGHHLGGREPPFGSARSLRSSVARR